MSSSQSSPPHQSAFDDLLQSADLPEPGPEYYAARRRLWLTPRQGLTPRPPSPGRQRLEDAFAHENAFKVWTPTVDKLWHRISSGSIMKYSMRLDLVIKLIHAAWIHFGTWPSGMQVQDSDEEQQEEERIIPVINSSAPSSSTPASSSTIPLSAVTSGSAADTQWRRMER